METIDAMAALKDAVVASQGRGFAWERGSRHSSKSWRIKIKDRASWVYVWPDTGLRYRVKYVNTDAIEVVRHCGNPADAVSLAERFSLGQEA